jgi:mRNA interferase YafQ
VRAINQTGQFKRDLKREAKGKHRATLEDDLMPVF